MYKWRAGKHLGGLKPQGSDRRGNSTQEQIEIVRVEREGAEVFVIRSIRNKYV